jgi:hypothetical protein
MSVISVGRIARVLVLLLCGFAILHLFVELVFFSNTQSYVSTHMKSNQLLDEDLCSKQSRLNSTDPTEELEHQTRFHSQLTKAGALQLSEFEMKRMIDSLVAQYQIESLLQLRNESKESHFDVYESTILKLLKSRSILTHNGNLCSGGASKNKFCRRWSELECSNEQGVTYHSFSGMGSIVNNFVNVAGAALHFNRSICLGDSLVYGSLQLYFQAGRCGHVCSEGGNEKCDVEALNNSGHARCRNYHGSANFGTLLTSQPGGWNLEVKREFAESTLRLSKEVTSIVESQLHLTFHKAFDSYEKQGIDCFRKNVTIGVHIRRGDKHKEAALNPMDKYVKHVASILEKEKISMENVVLVVASDDQSAVQEFKDMMKGIAVVSLDKIVDFSSSGFVEAEWHKMSLHQKYIGGLEFMTEVEALARSDFVVCGHSSNVCRLIQMIRTANENSVVSVDERWSAF